MQHPITLKSLIKNSGSLKIIFMVLLILTTYVIIQAIMFETNDCGYSETYIRDCNYYYNYPNQCRGSDNKAYCCNYKYTTTCGDQFYCREKRPQTYRYYFPCYLHYFAMLGLIGLSLITLIILTVKLCLLWRRAKREKLMRQLRLHIINPNMYQPPVIQPQSPVPQTYRQNGVNVSTEE